LFAFVTIFEYLVVFQWFGKWGGRLPFSTTSKQTMEIMMFSMIRAVGRAPPSPPTSKNYLHQHVFNDLGGAAGAPYHLPAPKKQWKPECTPRFGQPGRAPLSPRTSKNTMEIIMCSMMGVCSLPKLLLGGKGAEDFRIPNTGWDCSHFHGVGSGREGADWLSWSCFCYQKHRESTVIIGFVMKWKT
jgi:hypothetical protein